MVMMGKVPDTELEKIRNGIMAETDAVFRRYFPAEKLALELEGIVFSDVTEIFDNSGDLKRIPSLPLLLRRAIKKIKLNKRGTEYELYDKLEAIKLVADLAGHKPPAKSEVEHTFGNLSDEQLEGLIDALTSKRAQKP